MIERTNSQISEQRFRIGAELFYWLGVPIVVGLMIGWFRVGYIDAEVKLAVLVFWVGFVLFSWCSGGLFTWLAKILLRPWAPSLWFLCLFGVLVLGIVNVWPMNQLLIFGKSFLPQAAVPMGPMQPEFSSRFLMIYLSAVVPGALLWTGINLLYDRVLGMPRFSYRETTEVLAGLPVDAADHIQQTVASVPSVLRRVSDANRGNLLALQAQEHYVMVYTDRGDELITYSFGNALQDLEADAGLRVHRSWWVASDAVERMERIADKWQLLLKSGQTVPVSRSYVNAAKNAFD